ncbi:MAG: stage V sporulation protein AD [Blautia sp.]|nr:stage V sporulation protein AD [Blautia sp.]
MEEQNKKENQILGKQSIAFARPAYIRSYASIVGKKEGDGPLGAHFDQIEEDDKFGEKSWEEAESVLQKRTAELAIQKAGIKADDIRLIFAGDLLAQSIASSFGIGGLHRPMYGLFGACSTMGESLALAAMSVCGGFASTALAVTSSHFATAEKEFRFPLGYGNQRPLSASWTVTGSGACVVDTQKSRVKIAGVTTGIVTDYGMKDSQNMGACMAPAAADTIEQNLKDLKRKPEDYDRIITGDLGYVGKRLLLELLEEKGIGIKEQHMDCGIEIFDQEKQDTHSGGSGCGCSAVTLAALILPKLVSGEWKRVLFVPTGALLSTVSYNEGQSVPGIAHAVVLEHNETGLQQ